jgi:hypothetical protein
MRRLYFASIWRSLAQEVWRAELGEIAGGHDARPKIGHNICKTPPDLDRDCVAIQIFSERTPWFRPPAHLRASRRLHRRSAVAVLLAFRSCCLLQAPLLLGSSMLQQQGLEALDSPSLARCRRSCGVLTQLDPQEFRSGLRR